MFNPINRHRSRPRIQKIRENSRDWFIVSLTIISWSIFLFLIFFVDPSLLQNIILPNSYSPFFIITFFTFSLTLYLILKEPIRSCIYTLALLFLLFLSLKDLGHILNFFLIGALLLAYEVFFGVLSGKLPFSGRS